MSRLIVLPARDRHRLEQPRRIYQTVIAAIDVRMLFIAWNQCANVMAWIAIEKRGSRGEPLRLRFRPSH